MLEGTTRSEASTPSSTKASQQGSEMFSSTMLDSTDDFTEFQGVSRSGSKSLDMLDNLEETSQITQFRQVSCTDIKDMSKLKPKTFYDAKDSNVASSTTSFK